MIHMRGRFLVLLSSIFVSFSDLLDLPMLNQSCRRTDRHGYVSPLRPLAPRDRLASPLPLLSSKMSAKAVVGRALRETGAALKQASGAEIFTRHRPNMMFNGVKPFKTNDTFVAPSASIIGDVTNWDESSVWYGAVVRADSGHPVTIGFSSNVQDRAVINTLPANVETMQSGFPPICHVGHYVSVGAGSVLVSCTVEDLVDIGEKCTIMEGAIVETNTILEPGTVVPAYARIPSGQKWGGNPAKFIGNLTDQEKADIKDKAEKIHLQASEHLLEFLPIGNTYVHLEELEQKGAAATQG